MRCKSHAIGHSQGLQGTREHDELDEEASSTKESRSGPLVKVSHFLVFSVFISFLYHLEM